MTEIGPAELLRRRVATDPSRPFVTFYDDATDERVELSARTFDNWVAKTANLLVDGLGAQPGDRVVLMLPPHWQTAVWLMACWSAGLVAEPVPPPGDPATAGAEPGGEAGEPAVPSGPYLLAAAEEVLDTVIDDAGTEEIVGLSLHSLGGPLAACPPGVVDYAAEVRAHGDRFTPDPSVTPDDPALTVPGRLVTKTTLSAAGVTYEARAAVEKWGLGASDRILVDLPFTTLNGVLCGLVAPLASGASVIIQRNPNKAAVDRRVILEHVTAVAGVSGWNDATGSVRRLL
ncbi:acyl-CoA synthetase [Actinomadura rubrobrunea]|uniref:Acyl-CoA synthetase n=1 Tax=Actinomadura rubrobrunea TaxID=115335 RepID=A0A9W6USN5_9ACTN|nr:TIGR03089 family protein [Actinomadura rubrobrunea]GLW61774.1 acyl-CoA synthetase [Actinomadura rubrobrunea]